MRRPRPSPGRRERGQVLVVFSLALIAIVAMTGLVLDGGDTFVRRRDQQNVVDAAAMAAAYSYANGGSSASIAGAAWSTTAANGYTNLVDGVVVTVNLNASGGASREITVTMSKPHKNNFAGVVGLSSWTVTTTATAKAGRPNAALGAMPIIFNQRAFDGNGAGSGHETIYDEPDSGSADIPATSSQFNWTMYCDLCNADSNVVDQLIDGGGLQSTVNLSDQITPLNAGSHVAQLYSDLAKHIGEEFPVPIVDDGGHMLGWAMFHLTGSLGGSYKQIRGYFVSPINSSRLRIDDSVPAGGDFGGYLVYLVN